MQQAKLAADQHLLTQLLLKPLFLRNINLYLRTLRPFYIADVSFKFSNMSAEK